MKLILLGLLAVIIVGYTAFTIIRPSSSANIFAGSQKIESTHAEAIRQSRKIYSDKKAQKVDFDQSPCLSEDMGNGYALDISHNPREQIDDQVQCSSYQNGTVKHFVELSPEGNIMRIQ